LIKLKGEVVTSYVEKLVFELSDLQKHAIMHSDLMNSLYRGAMFPHELEKLSDEQNDRLQRIRDIEVKLSKIFAGTVTLAGYRFL
jgi:hypothetical protein